MSAFSEMESAIIKERVRAGLLAAKENGKIIGRPPLIDKRKYAINLFYNSNLTPKEIATKTGLGVSTVYKIIKEEKNSTLDKIIK